MSLHLSFLGSPQIKQDGCAVVLPRRKSVALLAYLAVTAVPHSREFLAALFWPGFDTSRALAYFRRALWEINHALDKTWLQASREQIYLPRSDAVRLDVAFFLDRIKRKDKTSLKEAHTLYRGEFLEGFALRDSPEFDEWQLIQRETLRQRYSDCLQRLAGLAVAEEELETAVAYARHWLSLDILNEAAHRQLMNLYVRLGQRATALQQYEICAQTLLDELNIPPEPATELLMQAIRQGKLPALVPIAPNGRLRERQGQQTIFNLPQSLTPFIGRSRELVQIERILTLPATRLLTLVGPGGIGKTRLAIEAAQNCQTQFPDGVCFVPLVALNAAHTIPFAIAEALGQHTSAGADPLTTIVDYLSTKKLLLILDNFEHLLDGVGFVYDLLTRSPQTTILVTSRRRLALPGERLLTVPELSFPQSAPTHNSLEKYDAIAFFTSRASYLSTDIDLDAPENQQHIIQICRLVEGHPLALKLAASWIRSLTLADIVRELESNLVDLESRQSDTDVRHRSLRGVFDFSWQLLTPVEQDMLQKLAVFRGGFTREAAAVVADFPHSVLAGLIEKSLVSLMGNGRYIIHNVFQEFALEKLRRNPQQTFAAQARHWDYFSEFLAQQETALKSSAAVKNAYQQIHLELANIQTGWQFALTRQQFAHMEKTLHSMWLYFSEYRSEEGRRLLQQTAEILRNANSEETNRLLWKVMTIEIYLIGFYNRKEVVLRYAPAIIDYLRTHPAYDWDMLSFVIVGWAYAYDLIDRDESDRLGKRFIAKAQELDDPYELSRALQGMGWMNLFLYKPSELDLAEKYSQASVEIAIEHQVLMVQYLSHWQLGIIALRRENYEEALAYGRLSLEGCEQAGILGFAQTALHVCIHACLALRDLDQTRHYLRQALLNPRSQQSDWQQAIFIYAILKLEQENRFVEAIEMMAAYEHQSPPPNIPALLHETYTHLKAELPSETCKAAQERGKLHNLDTLIQHALHSSLPIAYPTG